MRDRLLASNAGDRNPGSLEATPIWQPLHFLLHGRLKFFTTSSKQASKQAHRIEGEQTQDPTNNGELNIGRIAGTTSHPQSNIDRETYQIFRSSAMKAEKNEQVSLRYTTVIHMVRNYQVKGRTTR